ncbi:MAG: hypothetical protein ACE144_13255 [Thermodesulfobacteriota bacterium]
MIDKNTILVGERLLLVIYGSLSFLPVRGYVLWTRSGKKFRRSLTSLASKRMEPEKELKFFDLLREFSRRHIRYLIIGRRAELNIKQNLILKR